MSNAGELQASVLSTIAFHVMLLLDEDGPKLALWHTRYNRCLKGNVASTCAAAAADPPNFSNTEPCADTILSALTLVRCHSFIESYMHGTNFAYKDPERYCGAPTTSSAQSRFTSELKYHPAPRSEVACLGVTPAWRYQARLREVAGVGVSINNFTWDFYDSGDNLVLNRQTNSSPDFATLFNDCGTSSSDIAPSGTVGAIYACTLEDVIADRFSWLFHGTDDNGNDIEVSGTEVLEDTTTTSSLSRRDSSPSSR